VVDDGSTDLGTVERLKQLERRGLVVLRQSNGGPSKARNAGINHAAGKYILPLDADNCIYPAVFERAFAIMEQNPELAVTFTDVELFGEINGVKKQGKLDIYHLLLHNQVDTCSLIRKEIFEELGGFDENREIMSNEDWELWLRLLFNGKQFYYLEEPGFRYRIASNSLSVNIAREKDHQQRLNYLVRKYPVFYMNFYQDLYHDKQKLEFMKSYTKKNKIKSILKIALNKSIEPS
jgi:glycosyltransferase involved in cell wall biosynthesis